MFDMAMFDIESKPSSKQERCVLNPTTTTIFIRSNPATTIFSKMKPHLTTSCSLPDLARTHAGRKSLYPLICGFAALSPTLRRAEQER